MTTWSAKGTLDPGRAGQAARHRRAPACRRSTQITAAIEGDHRRAGRPSSASPSSSVDPSTRARDSAVTDAAAAVKRPGRASGAPWSASSSLVLARTRPVLRCSPSLFLLVPTFYLVVGSFQARRRAQFTLQNYADLADPTIIGAFQHQHRDQPRHRDRRRDLRLPARLRRHPRRPAAVPRRRADDLLGRRLELRRRPAGPGVHLHPRRGRAPHDPAPAPSGSTSYDGGFTLYSKIGLEIVLPLLPVPADGPDHRPGHRRPEGGVARGVREHGRQHLPVLAARRPADPACRRCSAR